MVEQSRRSILARGIAWTAVTNVFTTLLNFGAMLVLTRIIPASEYGRATAVVGVLTVLGCFNCGNFISHSMQLLDGEEPDWSSHWVAGVWLQIILCVACHLCAGVCWYLPNYRPIAPLLHIAAFGYLVDLPSQLRLHMLMREMNFRRMRFVEMSIALFSIIITLSLGVRGFGAVAIVLSNNLIKDIPWTIDLFLLQRWRPRAWIVGPVAAFKAYSASFHFGLRFSLIGLMSTTCNALLTTLTGGNLGYTALGLWSRAQSLMGLTVGRLWMICSTTIYPLLPRYADTVARYARPATLFLQVTTWATIPAAGFIGLEGWALSRVLYGQKWIAADPLFVPAAIGGAATIISMTIGTLFRAATQQKRQFHVEVIAVVCAIPAIFVTLRHGNLEQFAWTLGLGQTLATIICFRLAAPMMAPNWMRAVIFPPLVATLFGMAVAYAFRHYVQIDLSAKLRVTLLGVAYVVAVVLPIRVLFAGELIKVVELLPLSRVLRRALLLRPPEVPTEL